MTDPPRQETTLQEAQDESLESDRLERAEILRKYSDLVNDVDFDHVELGLKEADIFAILGIQRKEIRHSNFLAWMFDPNGSHGMGNAFLRRFLRDISLESPQQGQHSLDIAYTSPKTAEIRREWRNIDILVILGKHVICIENKVDSSDHGNQLLKYKNVVNEQFRDHTPIFVYLTPNGRPPNAKDQRNHYINYSYDKIVGHLDRLLLLHGRSLSSNINTYIADYTLNIRRNLMKRDHLNELAQKLYAGHKDVLDFIFENKPDIVSQVREYFSIKIKNEGFVEGSKSRVYVRFTTQELDRLLLKKTDGFGGWNKREQFLFEFEFLVKSSKKLVGLFRTGIHPRGDQEIRRILIDATGSPDIPSSSSKFSGQTKLTFTVLNDIAEGIDDDQMNRLFDTEWPRIQEIVSDVSHCILDRSEDIRSIYQSCPLADTEPVS